MQTVEHFEQIKYDDEENENNIFLLGIFVLSAWMIVIILCASPQLFRDFIQRHFCCCCKNGKHKSAESLREAQERMLANQSFLRSRIAENPSQIVISQVMKSRAPRHSRIEIPERIPEESRGSSAQPTSPFVSPPTLANAAALKTNNADFNQFGSPTMTGQQDVALDT